MTGAVLALTLLLAAANGSNDDPKGVATLGGAGVTGHRSALAWGVVTTLTGSVVSVHAAAGLTKLFSTGIVTARPTPAFALSVLVGATGWVVLATVTRLPVSTTHALVGSFVGAGLVLGPATIAWASLATRVAVPLVLSIAVAYAASGVLGLLPGQVPECVCVRVGQPAAGTPSGGALRATAATTAPVAVIRTGTVDDCPAHGPAGRGLALTVNRLHWLTAGAASFARGLNDTPKIVAVAAFALVPAGLTTAHLAVAVAGAMAGGGIIGGLRVARRLGGDVVAMDHLDGAKANLASAALVGLGAARGWPMSLTHVSTGAIAGTAGARLSRLNRHTLRDFALAWTVTPVVAGAVAASAFLVVR
jgi:PiT family inorganic phosphate transporter